MKVVLYSILIIISGAVCRAQPTYNFFHLFLEKGLSDGRVTDIVQDKYGFMWFATPNGLNRFDGYSIKTFYLNQQNGLPSNNITCLYSSRGGDLWIGTTNGLVKYDFLNEKFIHFDTTKKEAATIDKISIESFEEDNNGNIYVACAKGIFRYLKKEQQWENLNNIFSPKGTLRRIRRLKFFSDELLYASTSGNIPIFEINIKTYRYDSISIPSPDTCCPNTYGLEKLNNHEIIVGLLSNGVMKVNVKTKKFYTIPGVLGKNDSILYNTVYDILKDSRGRIWMASFYFRLAEYRPSENKIMTFEKDPYNPFGFDGNSALSIYEDRQHNIWVGTSGNGIYRFNPDNNAVRFYAANDFVKGALQRSRVLSLAVVDSNNLFVGTDKGPSFYNYTTKKHINYKGIATTGINAPLEYAQCGMVDKNKRFIWIGTNRLGLMRYDTKTGSFKCFSRVTKPYPLQDDGITDLLQLADGNIFLIGYGNPGIFNTKTFKYYSVRNDSINNVYKLKDVSSICYDVKQNIWLSTNNGKLYVYEPLQQRLKDKSDLISNIKNLKAIHKITWQNDVLYIAANAGLVLITKNSKPAVYSIKHPDNAMNEVRGVLPDGEYVWFCNSKILGRLNATTGKIIFLGERDGLANVQLFSRSLIKSPKSTILIGSNKGYYEIFSDRIKENDLTAAPFLTAFRVYDKQLITENAIGGTKTINLSHNQNFFAFDISAFNYEEAEDMEYAYMLEGFDKEWQYKGKQRSGSYTNVPGGNYILRLKARNSSGEWNENGQNIKIHVGKHFSETWWFHFLIFLLISAIFYTIYRFRIKQINKEAGVKSKYEIKVNELENSALRTQMNPHFIFNSLNTINSFISRKETSQAHQYISKFSKLIRHILDHSRQRKILLSEELEVLNLYIQIERIRFENKFDYIINVADGIDTSTVELPPLIIQPFVENAILHGLLPLDNNGFLQIDISHDSDILWCTVEDNGIGRERAKALKKIYVTNHKSHGIDITLKRIELFNNEHGKKETVTITDMPEGGTRVQIPVAWEERF